MPLHHQARHEPPDARLAVQLPAPLASAMADCVAVAPQAGWRRRVTPVEFLTFAAVWPVVAAMHAVVRLASFRRLEQLVARVPALWPVAVESRAEVVQGLGIAVQRARRYHIPGVKCLSAAAACTVLLRLRGLPAELVVGVRHAPFDAHAWTELDGQVVGERPETIAAYAVVRRAPRAA